MADENRSKQSRFFGVFVVMAAGLATFFVWLLRLISKPVQGTASIPSPAEQVRDERDVDNPSAKSLIVADSPSIEGEDAHLASTGKIAGQPENISPPQPVSNLVSGKSTLWTAPTRYLAGAGLFLFFLWLLIYSQQSLTLLVFAALIAILVRPATNFLQKRLRFSQGLAVLIIYLVVALLVFALPVLIIPSIAHATTSFLNYDWQSLLSRISETLNNLSAQVVVIPLFGSEFANSFTALAKATQNLLTTPPATNVQEVPLPELLSDLGEKVGFLSGLIGPIASGILSLIFMLLISLQMSLASGQIKGWFLEVFPDRYKGEIGSLLDRILEAWVSFLRGEFVLMVVMGLLTWLLNLLLGTPQALLLGLLAGLLEVVPSLGPILATIPAAILAVVFGSSVFPGLNPWVFMLIVIIGYVLLQAVENQVLVPRILGGAVSLPPLIVLIGVTVAGAKAGIVGVFLATPIMATGKELLEYVNRKINQEPEVKLPPDEGEPSFAEQSRSFMGRIRLLFWRTKHEKVQSSQVEDSKG